MEGTIAFRCRKSILPSMQYSRIAFFQRRGEFEGSLQLPSKLSVYISHDLEGLVPSGAEEIHCRR
jgi:hypothetical protein